MNETITLFVNLGLTHVLDFSGLDHFYFISILALPFGWKERNKLLLWVSLFTLGHTLSLVGNYYIGLKFSSAWVEFLIPVTIALSCLPVIRIKKPQTDAIMLATTLSYGLIHGLGFGRYFAMMVQPESATLSLLSFAVGVELAQCIIVALVLLFVALFSFRPRWQSFIKQMWGIAVFVIAIQMIFDRFPALLTS